MKKIIVFMSAVLLLLTSCGNEDIPQMPEKTMTKNEKSLTRSTKTYPVLSFESQSEFDSVVCQIATLNSSEAKLKWVKENYPNFESIQGVYSQALSEAESLDETEEEFLAFMDKYDTLYFPLVGDDAGFYIPVKDLDVSFLLSPACEVNIAGNLIDMKDIYSYDTLVSLGRAYYSNTQFNVSTLDYEQFRFDKNLKNIGGTFESGWRYNDDHDRKINVKIDRQLKELEPAPTYTVSESRLHIEVSFRKHTAFGWANYSSETGVVGSFKCDSITVPVEVSMKGTSSHDVYLVIPVHIALGDGNYYVATFPELSSNNLVVHFRGFDNRTPYEVKMTGAYCTIPYLGMILPKF
ncbi:MAG: hypothetical protein K2M27_06525 [Muribaculaceae bacterium]|nr:hypothetical protein [Muribaculaceae bacterium]